MGFILDHFRKNIIINSLNLVYNSNPLVIVCNYLHEHIKYYLTNPIPIDLNYIDFIGLYLTALILTSFLLNYY